MRAARHTGWLLAAVLAVGAVDVAVRVSARPAAQQDLPALQGFDPAEVDRISLGRADAPTVLERRDGTWFLAAPTRAPADPALVRELLEGLADGVVPDARVDDGDHERYGLDGGQELRVDVQAGERSLLDLYVGHDAGGGVSFVRLPGADDVYRARVGGRARFDRSPGAWRDRQVTDLDPASIVALRVGDTTVERDGDRWRSASGPLDGPTVAALVNALAKLRGIEVAAPGRELGEELEVTLIDASGAEVALSFGRSGELWLVRRGQDRWRVAPDLARLLASAPASLADRALWAGVPADVTRLEVRSDARSGLLERDSEGWRVVRPPNVDVDPRRADAAAEWLAAPRVDAWASGGAAFPSRHEWRVTLGGRVRTLELGASSPDGQRIAIRDAADPDRIGWIDARIVSGIEAIFGG